MNLRTRKLLAVASLVSGTTAMMTGTNALGQTAPASGEKVEKMEKFTVTGSYIPTTETAFSAGVSPVVRIDQKVIEESGMTNVSELLQKVTVSNGGSVPVSNNATGFTPAATSISQIGRAVQQECRDRSRMPSSA
eukprot:TRINITY_DN95812_c0_g1_i1.p1 TRINITY_DN95812_c0_g1~~TRINITY_DN95812_c0_g1_i1.p1  ORF type:complete len:135 (+),score=28.73 TRINITY_DN95812_c0_g1_i1:84-488(+)